MSASKYYVVWVGAAPGVYDSWEEAQIQVEGYPNASYRSFKSKEEAVEAFRNGYDRESLISEVARQVRQMNREGRSIEWQAPTTPTAAATEKAAPATATPEKATPYLRDSIAVDAACSGNPGPMEYRGVYVRTGEVLFRVGPMESGTNNIGEFLAIVHALALQERQGTRLPIYSDSVNAQKWVRQGLCRTKLECTPQNRPIFDLIRRAESWLRAHPLGVIPIYKWETKAWGEIPADFGRK
jgi:ribonuclease HI